MIELKMIERGGPHHFSIHADVPVRIEVLKSESGHLVVYVYNGAKSDREDEPVGMYDSADLKNEGWKWPPQEGGPNRD